MIVKTQKNINIEYSPTLSNCAPTHSNPLQAKIKSNTRKLLKTKRTHFFVKRCHQKIPKPYGILLIVYSINNRKESYNYFSNLTAYLTNKENTKSNLTSLLNNLPDENYDQSFHLNHTNYNEVYKIITNLKNDCSSGHDNIPVRYLKPVAEYITSPLVHIINTSIDQEIFPKQWKISRVCPIPKTDNPTSIKDYRPISVLSVLSKVHERVILNQLCSFIET